MPEDPVTPELAAFAADVEAACGDLVPDAGPWLAAGLAAADPHPATADAVADLARRAAVPVAAGKAAAPMARAWQDAGGAAGICVVPADADVEGLAAWEVRQAEHPVPAARSYAAGRRVRDVVREGLPVVLLISGGASALMEVPAVPDDRHHRLSKRLLAEGLPIDVLNAARSLLSEIKAGGLQAEVERARTRMTVLLASDVPGDDPSLVGSGPGVGVPYRDLVARVGDLPDELREPAIEAGRGRLEPDEAADHRCVLGRETPRKAVAEAARRAGRPVEAASFDGPAKEVADRLAGAARDLPDDGVLVVGGEPTVRVGEDPGLGGRLTHLACLLEQRLGDGYAAALVATDGDDGSSGAGGVALRLADGRDPVKAIRDRDTAAYLEGLGDDIARLVPARPSGANSADLGVVRRVSSSGT